MSDVLAPTATATTMFLKELLRRWRSVLFMVLMPTGYFAVAYLTADPTVQVPLETIFGDETGTVYERDLKAVYLSVLGLSVAGAFAALSTVRATSAPMRRLRLIGFRASQLLGARLLVLLAITATATVLFLAIFLPVIGPKSVPWATLALIEVGLLGVGLGTLLGTIFQREVEPAMIIVAVSGIQLAVGRSDSAGAEKWLLYTPAVDALKAATFTGTVTAGPFLIALGYIAALFAVSYAVFAARIKVSGTK